MKKKSKSVILAKNAGMIIAGSMLYALGMNLFLTPLHLFSGGGVGLAQLLTLFLEQVIVVENLNLYGIVYMLINIPLLFLAFFQIGKNFFVKTLIGSGAIRSIVSAKPPEIFQVSAASPNMIVCDGEVNLTIFAGILKSHAPLTLLPISVEYP